MYMYVFYQKPLVLVCAMVYGPRIAYSKRRKQLNKCHLDKKTAEALGHSFYSVKNDINGNPRYVIHWLAFGNDYDSAYIVAKPLGFSKYRGKNFGGGFVCQSYNLENTAERIIEGRQK